MSFTPNLAELLPLMVPASAKEEVRARMGGISDAEMIDRAFEASDAYEALQVERGNVLSEEAALQLAEKYAIEMGMA